MKLACVGLGALLAACNLANADLADLEDLTVRVSGGRSLAAGTEFLQVRLSVGPSRMVTVETPEAPSGTSPTRH